LLERLIIFPEEEKKGERETRSLSLNLLTASRSLVSESKVFFMCLPVSCEKSLHDKPGLIMARFIYHHFLTRILAPLCARFVLPDTTEESEN
jgi:hypothetical protein